MQGTHPVIGTVRPAYGIPTSRACEHAWEYRILSRSTGASSLPSVLYEQERGAMEVVYPICCGIDGHQATLTACLRRVSEDGQLTTELREFGTTYTALLALSDWLVAAHCPVVALESTGVDWKPIYHVLVGVVEVFIGNAYDMRRRPGKKTDKADAIWIAELLAHGLIQPSFIPPPEIRALRDLTRTRVALIQTRTQAKNRSQAILEDTNIKLASVASDVFGKSGRHMLEALIGGERDPQKLAAMALGKMKRKVPQLTLALTGQFTAHHGRLIQGALDLIDLLDRQLATIDTQIGALVEPLQPQIAQLDTIPGVDATAAWLILAEIGTDMRRFGSHARLASWAGVSPGNNESAGKRRRGKSRRGNRYLRRVLVQCAWAARKTATFLGRTFRRLEVRIGKKKAALAVAHKILVIIYHLLAEGTFYDEGRYAYSGPKQEERDQKRAIKALERLGSRVTIERVA
jgi:transposase